MKRCAPLQRGFTMVEAIVVLVITGIIGAAIAVFIKVPVQGYTDSVARAAATDVADGALRRLTRDLRLALPNSIRVGGGGTYIEYLETTAGLRYLAEDDIDPVLMTGNHLSWTDASRLSFTVVGGVPTDRHAPRVGNFVVVYNLGEGQEPGNAYNCSVPCNRARIAAIDTAAGTITLANNPFPAQAASVALTSPSRRFHVVTTPVTYRCDAATGALTRYWDYPISQTMQMPPTGGKSALLATRVKSCAFRYANLASQRSGLVGISLELRVGSETEGVLALEHQVHVDNTP
ncbi:type II secretion system GspH family protein [Massilia sp. PAMC28688]|uniref:type II secretion system protein n=1 Tax=Massilia sp. PAMC28688 TaxID=2861283 RepID=UPI001C6365AB|nr:type II secretion system protein [Massilia sp. PAMC28688]QYF93318.1 type II secretion system GspH family protein [Massilia sp. PAMC28688]